MIKQAVIFCGGFGKRLKPFTNTLPKPMIKVNGKPFLLSLINQCKSNGIRSFLILVGYKHEKIKNHFKDGKKFNVKINYSFNPPQTQTFRRLMTAKSFLNKEFLLMYCDNYLSLNLHDLYSSYKKNKKKICVTVCKKTPGNIKILNKNRLINKYYFEKNYNTQYVDVGYMIVKKNIFSKIDKVENESFSNFLNKNINKKKVSYYFNDNNYLSISDPLRYKKTQKYFEKKIILIDRDGVLNKKNTKHRYVRNLDELEINYKFLNTYKNILNKSSLICITNQAGISTGDLKLINLKKINLEIYKECKKKNIELIDFFISNHHFKSNNFDRKPNHGLFLKAALKHKFILDKTFYIGDDIRDIEAAYNAKTKCFYIGSQKLNSIQKEKYKFSLIKL